MARPRKKSNRYFTGITQAAIVAYNKLDSDNIKREKIFNRFIHAPLAKLAENLVNNWDTDYIDESGLDLQMTVMSYLIEKLPKFNPDTGSKAFSYFTIVGRNYLIMKNKKGYDKLKNRADVLEIDIQRNISTELHILG